MMYRKNRIEYRERIWYLVDSLVEALIVGVSVRKEESTLTTLYYVFYFWVDFSLQYFYLTLCMRHFSTNKTCC